MYLGKIMEIGPAERVIRDAAQPVHAGARLGLPVAGPADGGASGRRGRSSSARRRTPRTSRPAAGSTRAVRCAFDRCKVEEPPLFDVGERPARRVLAGRGRPAGPPDHRRGARRRGRSPRGGGPGSRGGIGRRGLTGEPVRPRRRAPRPVRRRRASRRMLQAGQSRVSASASNGAGASHSGQSTMSIGRLLVAVVEWRMSITLHILRCVPCHLGCHWRGAIPRPGRECDR